jgi:hypothetical protein
MSGTACNPLVLCPPLLGRLERDARTRDLDLITEGRAMGDSSRQLGTRQLGPHLSHVVVPRCLARSL